LYATELLERLARAIPPEDVQLYYQTAIVGRRDLALASDPRTGFEMALLRMIAFRPQSEAGAAPPAVPGARARAPGPTPGAQMRVSEGPDGAARDMPSPATPAAAVATPAGTEDWGAIISAMELQGAARQLATHCVLVGREGAVVRLALDPRSKFMRTPAVEEKLAQALARHYGEPVRLEFTTAISLAETPAQAGERATQEEAEAARR